MGAEHAVNIGNRLELFVDEYLIDSMTDGAGLRLHKPILWEAALVGDEIERVVNWKQGSDVGSRKQLFIDDALTASSQGIELTMNPPAKTGDMTIQSDLPWEGVGVGEGSIVQVGEEYRLYYDCYCPPGEGEGEPVHRLCMAVSTDGIHWEKPSLGLVDYNGSKDNNIVFPTDGSSTQGAWVFRDTRPDIGAEEQYKMICRWTAPRIPGATAGHGDISEWVLQSDDGLRWSPMADGPAYRYSDTTNSAFWDERTGRSVS